MVAHDDEILTAFNSPRLHNPSLGTYGGSSERRMVSSAALAKEDGSAPVPSYGWQAIFYFETSGSDSNQGRCSMPTFSKASPIQLNCIAATLLTSNSG